MSVLSNHFPEILADMNRPGPYEPTEADWQEYEQWADAIPPAPDETPLGSASDDDAIPF